MKAKNNGFKKGFAYGLVFFTLIISTGIKSQNISTRAEIYDYEIGDIFHYNYTGTLGGSWHDYSIKNIEILDKFYTQDTLPNYIRDIKIKSSSSDNPEWVFEHFIDTMHISFPSSPIWSNIDSTGVNQELYNGRLINYYTEITHDIIKNKRFVVGCGNVLDEWNEWGWYSGQITELVYYKKGDEEWGTPNPVSVDEFKADKRNLILYPNPAKSTLKISTNDFENIFVEIFDISGNLVMNKEIITVAKTIDISQLNAGLYLIKIKTGGSIVFRKLIKE
jgi:hypothetical protein